MPVLVASTSLLVRYLEYVLVCYGLLKEPSWSHTHMKVTRESSSVFSGLSSTSVQSSARWYVCIYSLQIRGGLAVPPYHFSTLLLAQAVVLPRRNPGEASFDITNDYSDSTWSKHPQHRIWQRQ
jgi:hypothetical protein